MQGCGAAVNPRKSQDIERCFRGAKGDSQPFRNRNPRWNCFMPTHRRAAESAALRRWTSLFLLLAASASLARPAEAINGGTLQVNPRNGWKAFEVISVGDNPAGDGFSWSMPATFDGVGAWPLNGTTLRLQVNHENSDATISEIDLNRANLQTATEAGLCRPCRRQQHVGVDQHVHRTAR
jgi:hypothetical protein